MSTLTLPLALSLYTPYAVQPGLKVATSIGAERVYVAPHVAAFSRPWNHTTGELGVHVGYRFGLDGDWSSAVSAGVAYQAQSQVVGETIDLSGSYGDTTRELRHAVVPTVRYELTRRRAGADVFGAVAAGEALRIGLEPAATFSLELGMRFGGEG